MASASIAYVGQPVTPLPAEQPKESQLWYHQIVGGYFERWFPANGSPGLPSIWSITGTSRSRPVIPFCCAAWTLEVTRVGTAVEPACDERIRGLMSDQLQVAGGSSQM